MMLRWGMAGASKIADDFCVALQSDVTPNKNHVVVAVASKNKENARKFADKLNIPKCYDTFEQLAKANDIDMVYVSVLNPYHFEVARVMIEHKKNVLVEKPFCMNQREAKQLFQLAQQHNVYIVEGIWSRFFPVYRSLNTTLELLVRRDIKEVYVNHGFIGNHVERLTSKEMGGGIVLDIGVYAIQMVVFAFQEEPKTIKATGKLNENGVDLQFQAEMLFSGGRKASIHCSGMEELDNQATFITTKGAICIPTYYAPHKFTLFDELREWKSHASPHLNYSQSLGLKYEADGVYNEWCSGKKTSLIVPPEESLLIAKIEDEIRKQIGVHYNSDSIETAN